MDEMGIEGGSNPHTAWRADPPAPARSTAESAVAIGQGRIGELDGIRGLAAVAIVVFHAQPDWLPLGWAAVDLFFGLSGFLITSIVLKHGDSPGFLRQFYLRRGLRIWPIYYLTLLGFILFRHRLPVRCDWTGFWYYLTYTQNLPLYWSAEAPRFHGFLNHTWTLAIEEQFYLLWPVVVLLCGARRVPLLAIACAGLSVMARVLRLARVAAPDSDGRPGPRGIAGGDLALRSHHRGLAPAGSSGAWSCWVSLGVAALAAALHLSCKDLAVSGPGLLAINVVGMGLIGIAVTGSGSAWLAPLRWGPLTLPGEDQLRSVSLSLCHPDDLGRPAPALGPLGHASRPPAGDGPPLLPGRQPVVGPHRTADPRAQATIRVRQPSPAGAGSVDHEAHREVLSR